MRTHLKHSADLSFTFSENDGMLLDAIFGILAIAFVALLLRLLFPPGYKHIRKIPGPPKVLFFGNYFEVPSSIPGLQMSAVCLGQKGIKKDCEKMSPNFSQKFSTITIL